MSPALNNRFRTALLLSLLTLVVLFCGQALGGSQGLEIALVMALVMNLGAWWFSADLVLAQTRARLVGPAEAPELYQLVTHLAERAGLPTPRVAIVDDPAPNAFATGRNPAQAVVAVTTGLLSLLNREELAGVLGHELTHVRNRDILVGSVAAVLAGAIMLLANIAKYGLIFGGGGSRDGRSGHPLAVILMVVLAPLAGLLIQAGISRSREYLADDGGADIAGTPFGLASALAKLGAYSRPPREVSANMAHMCIVNPLNSKFLNEWFATHPPIEERVARLRGERP
ncbi:MAG: zinc metalloprotease HtpX [Candidatus Adiutrix sp.]|jgi:heat shock protein HtpX|nr:zinc metalloprotease HtpX [Candidatus Adiutrix sp.]